MNIQDVINRALSDNSDITVSEVRDTPEVVDAEITKLAAALNFIGTNLEQSVPTPEEVLAQAELTQNILSSEQEKSAFIVEGATGLVSHHNQKKRMQEAGRAGGLAGGISGMYLSTNKNQELADDAIRAHKASKKGRKGRKKTASVENDLYQAAQLGKESLLEKIAEDRINPAKISAGPADPYSGQIMPNPGAVSSEFVGSSRTPKALIDLKAQKVRARINSDMKKYVNNVGDGYNAEGHLTKFNK